MKPEERENADPKVLRTNTGRVYFEAHLHFCLVLIRALILAVFCCVLLLLRIIKLETPEGVISFRSISQV